MFLISGLVLAQAVSPPPLREILKPQEVRALPGKLDQIPVFNSNSPEMVQSEGILLSTFSPQGKTVPGAHLNFAFDGRFDLFAHHIAKVKSAQGPKTLYLGLILNNPSQNPAKILLLQAVSHLTQNAPFVSLPAAEEDKRNRIFSGPGSRATGDVLRWERGLKLPVRVDLQPGETKMLASLPIPASAVNGRTTLIRFYSNGKVYIASLALWARRDSQGKEQPPSLGEWQTLLNKGGLVQPRDRAPTPPAQTTGQFVYGRVAGVARGSEWKATLTDLPTGRFLTIPQPGSDLSYAINTLDIGTLGTKQIQSAPMVVRYPDTAYRAHGNYGVIYTLTLPLYNPSSQPQQVALMLQTPLKQNQLTAGGLKFLAPPAKQVFFRGTLRFAYPDPQGKAKVQYFHLVQHRGQQGQPLVTLTLPPATQKSVEVSLVYPPDATPPQVLTLQTLIAKKTAFARPASLGSIFPSPQGEDLVANFKLRDILRRFVVHFNPIDLGRNWPVTTPDQHG
jgi:Protein of unknown function (DUF3370)